MPHKIFRFKAARIALAAIACLLCLLYSGWTQSAIAHSSGQSYLYFQIAEESVSAHVAAPLQDLNELLALELPAERVTNAELAPALEKIRSYVEPHVDVQCPPQNCELTFTGRTSLNNTESGQFLQLYYDIGGYEQMPEALQVSYDVILADKPEFTNLMLVDNNWQTGTFDEEANVVATYSKAGEVKTLDLTSGSFLQGFLALEGIDHVLFLVALLLPSVVRRENGRWQPVGKFSTSFVHILKIATAFTVAHSITLGLATLQIVDLPSRWVESIIAVSIGLAALDIFYPIFRRRIWLVIFVFGLFHGFGFASVLADLGVTSQHAVLSLLAFNLGVELGQLVIIAVVFPVLYLLRKQLFYSRFVLKTGGMLLGVMSLYWLIERVFDVNIRILPLFQGLFA
ncbi:MAG: HupE/UreJ family protein [Phormidesmis sp.]